MSIFKGKSVRNAEKGEKREKKKTSAKRAGIISGNIHHRACIAHSELCEGGVHVSKNVMNLLHLSDSLSAEAFESIGRDSLYAAVLLQDTKQQTDQNT